MPVDFLSQAQAQRYGRYTGEPNAAQLARYFHLDAFDREQLAPRRGEHNRLGYAVQLGTVRYLGTFLSEPTAVPSQVVSYLASQLAVQDPSCLSNYARGKQRWEHAAEIKRVYGYRDFADQPEHFRLVRWLYTRAWLAAERPSVLFDLVTARLIERKILLPGVSTLSRLVAQVRDRTAALLWRSLAAAPTAEQRLRLEALLVAEEGARLNPLDQLRRSPTRISAPALVKALKRFQTLRGLGVGSLPLDHLPPGRVATLARQAAAVRTQILLRMPDQRRLATLLAFVRHYEAVAQDEALDLFDQLVDQTFAKARKEDRRTRLQTLPELEAAALSLSQVIEVVLDESSWDDAEVRREVFRRLSRDQLQAAVGTVHSLARAEPTTLGADALQRRYRHVRGYLPCLLNTLEFEGTQAAGPVLKALNYLRRVQACRPDDWPPAPVSVVPKAQRGRIFREDSFDHSLYTLCVIQQLQEALGHKDLFVSPSERWGNPRSKLLDGAAWTSLRPQVCRMLGRRADPEVELADLTSQLAAAYQITGEELPSNDAVRLEPGRTGQGFTLAALDRLDEPPGLPDLRRHVTALIPRTDLTDLVLEIAGWTGFTRAFRHLSESRSRVDDLNLSICAVLVAEACNIGLEPLVQPHVPALTRDRLSWVQQNYLRAETITAANAKLVDAQAQIPLAQVWGGGDVASADGLRFVVPVRTLNAGPNRKYFGVQRGVTYYNFASDQFTGLHGIVIPGTTHEAPYLLEGLLEQQTSLQPREVMADTAAYSDVIFGLFWLLGYQFSPRLADVGEARFWRLDPQTDHGPLNGLARHQLKSSLIANNWDDLLRVAGSLKLGTVRGSELVRSFQGTGKQSGLGRALVELGRVAKTLYLLDYMRDESYRRRILVQLTRQERRHRLARVLFHGQRGELRERYREGQEDQLGALGLVLNAVVLWNTRYLDAALNHLRATGHQVDEEAVARLSPLLRRHINFLGQYRFSTEAAALGARLRPFHQGPPEDAED